MSFNFLNNIYMLGAHFMYVTLSKHPTTCTLMSSPDTVSNFSVSQWDHTFSMVGCHNHFPTASPQRDCMSQSTLSHDNLANWCGWPSDGPHLTVAHPARQDMCQVTLYSKTNNTYWCQTSRVDLCVFLFLYRVSNRRSWKPSARLFTERGHES